MSSGTPSRGNPALFNADLFSSPPDGSSGLSSLGFGDDIFSGGSPFTLAPAAPAVITPSQSSDTIQGTSSTTSKSEEVLSTIPLDSPTLNQVDNGRDHLPPNAPVASMSSGSVHGWNDPPFISSLTPNRSVSQPVLSDSADTSDPYHVQPLVDQTHQRRSESPNPATTSLQAPPPSDGGSNPYRLGGKRQARTATSAYTIPPVSAPTLLSQAPPTGLPTNYSAASLPPSTAPPPIGTGSVQSSVLPVQPHWFYLRSDGQDWFPFSIIDSSKLEEIFLRLQADTSINVVVQTDGGRYDVDVQLRKRVSVYWEEPPADVRRCTWFYKGDEDRWYIPYVEEIAAKLENAFSTAVVQGNWNCRVDLPNGEAVIIHSPSAMAHYSAQQVKPFNHEVDYKPKGVLRGFVERGKVEMGEDRTIDHLVFIVHGIGPFADIRMNTLIDCVDDFREVSQLLMRTHKFGGKMRTEGRVEFLPVHWHSALHGDDVGVDKQVRDITLPSISRLRDFTNTTLIDILFYTSPLYLQTIVDQVSSEMNRMLNVFNERNPSFSGDVAVMGHSLGSCILFDLLYHQGEHYTAKPSTTSTGQPDAISPEQRKEESEEEEVETPPTLIEALTQLGVPQLMGTFEREMIDFDSLIMCSNDDLKDIGIPLGARKKLSNFIDEWSKKIQLEQDKKIRMAEEKLAREREEAIQLQTQQEVSQLTQGRIEGVKFVKGVAGTGEPLVVYPPLNFNPSCLFAVGSPIALFLTLRGVETLGPDYHLPTCPAIYNIFHPFDPVAYRLEPLVVSLPPTKAALMPHHRGRKRFHLELYENIERVSQSVRHHLVDGIRNMWHQLNELARAHTTTGVIKDEDTEAEVSSQGSVDTESSNEVHVPIGVLSGGNRIDHVLQEKTIETINEYLFALSSHLCYWRSEDTALFILKQIYSDPNPELIQS